MKRIIYAVLVMMSSTLVANAMEEKPEPTNSADFFLFCTDASNPESKRDNSTDWPLELIEASESLIRGCPVGIMLLLKKKPSYEKLDRIDTKNNACIYEIRDVGKTFSCKLRQD